MNTALISTQTLRSSVFLKSCLNRIFIRYMSLFLISFSLLKSPRCIISIILWLFKCYEYWTQKYSEQTILPSWEFYSSVFHATFKKYYLHRTPKVADMQIDITVCLLRSSKSLSSWTIIPKLRQLKIILPCVGCSCIVPEWLRSFFTIG